MTLKEYILKRLDEDEQDLRVLSREARIRIPSVRRVSSNYLRNSKSAWRQKRSKSVGERIGQPLSRESVRNSGADVVHSTEGKTGGCVTDASQSSSRRTAHGSGATWVATPSSQWTLTTYSLPGLPAHSLALRP